VAPGQDRVQQDVLAHGAEGQGLAMRGGTAVARLDGEGLRLLASTGSGHDIIMDSAEDRGGPRPAELLLVAQAGCTAMDVVSILRRERQPFTSYEVRVAGD